MQKVGAGPIVRYVCYLPVQGSDISHQYVLIFSVLSFGGFRKAITISTQSPKKKSEGEIIHLLTWFSPSTSKKPNRSDRFP